MRTLEQIADLLQEHAYPVGLGALSRDEVELVAAVLRKVKGHLAIEALYLAALQRREAKR